MFQEQLLTHAGQELADKDPSFLTAAGDNYEVCFTHSEGSWQDSAPVAHRGPLLFAVLPSMPNLPMVSGITSQMNFLCSSPFSQILNY